MNNPLKTIQLGHGSGGELSKKLFEDFFLPSFSNPLLESRLDGAILEIGSEKIAFSTDSFVVSPLFFPGGDIGDLAVNGTVNDLAMCGAEARYISTGFIIEEGFLIEKLKRVIVSMQKAAKRAGVEIVTGDTKVVERGKGDGLYINSTGIGRMLVKNAPGPSRIRPGDRIIINGNIGDHGIVILTCREGLKFESELKSDTAPLNGLITTLLRASRKIHCLRDPTRGGLASTLNEIALDSGFGIEIDEDSLPVHETVTAACDILGLDPLMIANEGKALIFVAEDEAESLLELCRKQPLGKDSMIIGRVSDEFRGKVVLNTRFGARRLVEMPAGEQLPRIC